MINSTEISNTLNTLAHPSRVDILKCLLQQCPNKMQFGAIAKFTNLKPATLTHHLREMENGGLITREPNGRTTLISLEIQHLKSLLASLMELCCSGKSDQK